MTGAHAAFERGADSAEYIAIEGAAGPWSPDTCHGGAPAALLVQVAEAIPAPAPMSVARVTVDLLRAVPLGRLRVECRVIREGRKIQLLALGLGADGVRVVTATILRVRNRPEAVPDPISAPDFDIPAPTRGARRARHRSVAFRACSPCRRSKAGSRAAARRRSGFE